MKKDDSSVWSNMLNFTTGCGTAGASVGRMQGLVLMLLLSFQSLVAAEEGGMVLADGGKACCVIVVADQAQETEKTAAATLQAGLKEVTGAEFKISTESEVKADTPQILVGRSKRLDELCPKVNWADMKEDGILVKTVGPHLLLAGGRPRGTIYAVHDFLEHTVGCRWWTSTEKDVPSKPALRIPSLNVLYVPKLSYRDSFYADVNKNPGFAVALKSNGNSQEIPASQGGHYSMLGFVHTFYKLLPPEKYFSQHPEWYSEINGKRTPKKAQLCLTNEEMRKELTRVALEWIRENPRANMISISQNDGFGKCECDQCQALEETEGSPSGPLLHFVNAVARDIAKEYPDMLVETLAYQYTRKPPRQIKPAGNVVIRLCSLECSFSRPMTDKVNLAFQKDIQAWLGLTDRLMIWDYVANFKNLLIPHPNLRVLEPNVRFFVKNHAMGVFEEGDYLSNMGDFEGLRAWVLAHLMWNPDLDGAGLIKTFVTGYYGGAAPSILAYLDLIHDAFEQSGRDLKWNSNETTYLSLEQMNRATRLWEEAGKAVAHDPKLSLRVRRDRLPLDLLWILRYPALAREAKLKNAPFLGPKDRAQAIQSYLQTAHEFNASASSEGMSFSLYADYLRSLGAPPPPPPECKELLSENWSEIYSFRLEKIGTWSKLVEDPLSSTGKASWLSGGHVEWAIQGPLNADILKNYSGAWHCYLVARCEVAKGYDGDVLNAGLYDAMGAEHVFQKILKPISSGGGYETYDLGVREMKDGMYFYVAAASESKEIHGIFVDRIFFIKEKREEVEDARH